ncbi:MAG: hypothetical protein HPY66_1480 [Firmicutes bacterium]|nr:hypothetical protein [Bacillota bacterium]
MLIEGLCFALVVGKIRGGKFRCLGQVQIHNWWLFLLSFAIEFGALFAVSAGIQIAARYSMYLHILSYLILFIGIMSNREYPSMWVVFLGSFLNFLVITLNGGAMPISIPGLLRAGLENSAQMISAGGYVTHRPLTEATRLPFLADIFVLPAGYPFPKVLSVGDILISIGIFLFVQRAMFLEKRKSESHMIRFKYKSRI